MKSPATYGEWMLALDAAAERFGDPELLAALREGTLDAGATAAARLLERIVEFENVVLNRRVRRLERELSLAADGDSETLWLLLARFSRDCESLLFFRELACLPSERLLELEQAVRGMVYRVFADLRRHLETHGEPDQDVVYVVSRAQAEWARGATA